MKKQIKPAKQTRILDVTFIKEIRNLITAARSAVVKNVDYIQVHTCFEIGRRIVEYEQKGSARAEYGKQLIIDLSVNLTVEFGRGFSRSNLEYMRKFYLVYQGRFEQIQQTPSAKLIEEQKSQTLSRQSAVTLKSQMSSGILSKSVFALSWSQYIFLIGIKDEEERSFYEIEAANNGWTLPELARQFNSGLYERLALSRDKEGVRKLAKEGQVVTKPEDLLKGP